MGKDPAFLFYYQDFLVGTSFMTLEETGAYIKLLCFQADKGELDEKDILKKIPIELWKSVKDKFQENNGKFFNKRLNEEVNKRKAYTESRRQSRLKCDEDSVRIYLIKDLDTKYTKIGSSVNPLRRFAEMCNQENPAKTVGNRNYRLIFSSRIVPRSEELKLHEIYKNKNIIGEWFDLSEEDTKNICKTYDECAKARTENENENTNKDVIKDIIDDLNSVLQSSYKYASSKNRELIRARLNEGHTFEDFKTVHRKMAKAWGLDNKMRQYLRPLTLYSNKFESYLNRPEDIRQLTPQQQNNIKQLEELRKENKNDKPII
jgi:uncharacterized phage protein (TIGR02220 family)